MNLHQHTRDRLVSAVAVLGTHSTPENSLGEHLVATTKILADAVLVLTANDDKKPEAESLKPHVRRRKGHAGKSLSKEQKREIVSSMETPGKLMLVFNIKFGTIRRIKNGLGAYAEFGGSNENWVAYKDKHGPACRALSAEEGPSTRRHVESFETRMLDIVTSPEPPTTLIERYRRSMDHIRAVKRGYGRYARFGGTARNWSDYYQKYARDIDRLLSRSKRRAA